VRGARPRRKRWQVIIEAFHDVKREVEAADEERGAESGEEVDASE
jgi:hypothetical protein